MKKILLAALAMGALALGAPTATADPGHYYVGGCGFATVNDTTPTETLGGQEQWTGEISILAYSATGPDADPAVPTGESIEVRCDLYKNNVLFRYDALSAAGANGIATNAGTLRFENVDSVITVCEHVSVNNDPAKTTYHCDDSTRTPLIPEPIQVLINDAIATLNREVFEKIDPTLCGPLAAATGTYGPIYIAPDGDIYLFGTDPEDLWWDCPPYQTTP